MFKEESVNGTPAWTKSLDRIGPVLVAALMLACLLFVFRDGLWMMMRWWSERDEYNHGFLIPVVALYLLALRAREFEALRQPGSWLGVCIVGVGLIGFLLGELSAIYVIIQYSFLLTLVGVIITAVGWNVMTVAWVPFVYLIFMIPLPSFLYDNLSNELALMSSRIGVYVVRLAGISVYLEGNVIDLGSFKLQVAEACSGLRYLFPLMSFGFLCAYLYKGKTWHRVVIFLSSIPLTILMNSFRIGVIGVLVEHFGISMARGFLHDFEGWVIFMACVAILFLEMWFFAWISGRRLSDVFDVEVPAKDSLKSLMPRGKMTRPQVATVLLLVLGLAASFAVQNRKEWIPEHVSLSTFPLVIEEWRGYELGIEEVYLDQLKLSDYVLASYARPGDQELVSLYVAYYDSQRKGASVHSPRACIPAGGWAIDVMDKHVVAGMGPDEGSLIVNRAVIAMGTDRQLVYYWFAQRGRNLTNEYLVKWFIFWDGLTQQRTDGALVRLTTSVPEAASLDEADQRLQEFMKAIDPKLYYHIPQEAAVLREG